LEEGEEGEDGADGFESSDAFEGNEENDVDVEILDVPPLVFKTPRKKRAVRVKEKIDDSFLRHSRRISNKLQGFKDAKSARKAKEPAADEDEPIPLAMVPPPGCNIAPHLPKEILRGIGEGFLQIQSEIVSAALLEKDDIDE